MSIIEMEESRKLVVGMGLLLAKAGASARTIDLYLNDLLAIVARYHVPLNQKLQMDANRVEFASNSGTSHKPDGRGIN